MTTRLTSVRRTGPERRRESTQTAPTASRHLALVHRNLDLMGWTTTMYLAKQALQYDTPENIKF